MTKKRPPSKRKQQDHVSVIRQETTEAMVHTGPLPPPEMLFQYDQVLPGSAQTILEMAIKEQATRHQLAESAQATLSKSQQDDATAEERGQWMAFVLVFACIIAAVWSAYTGHELMGCILAGAPLASVIIKIITRKE